KRKGLALSVYPDEDVHDPVDALVALDKRADRATHVHDLVKLPERLHRARVVADSLGRRIPENLRHFLEPHDVTYTHPTMVALIFDLGLFRRAEPEEILLGFAGLVFG